MTLSSIFSLLLLSAVSAADWCRNDNKYLSGYPDGGKVEMITLEEAQMKCLQMEDECGGITKEPLHGNVYSLRKGTALMNSTSNEIAYTKGACKTRGFCAKHNTYLSGDTAGGPMTFSTLGEAISACNQKSDCNGFHEHNNVFTLRVGPMLVPGSSISWTTGGCEKSNETKDQKEQGDSRDNDDSKDTLAI